MEKRGHQNEKAPHPLFGGKRNRPSLQRNYRRKFVGELMSFMNSAGEKTGSILRIG